jgi:predicted esterase
MYCYCLLKEDVYSWFNWEPEDKWSEPDRYFGVEESVEHLKQQFLQYGPFDGVLGFSQGGVMLSILTGMRVLKEKSSCYDPTSHDPIAFDFAIFCATFAPPRPEYFLYIMKSNKCAPLATLHVYGTGDPLVKCEMSKKLASEFELQAATPETKETASETDIRNYKTTVMHLEHSGGHYVATNGEAKATFRAFFAALAFHFPSTPHHDKRTN